VFEESFKPEHQSGCPQNRFCLPVITGRGIDGKILDFRAQGVGKKSSSLSRTQQGIFTRSFLLSLDSPLQQIILTKRGG